MTAMQKKDNCDFGKNTRLILLAFMTICLTGIGWCMTNDWRQNTSIETYRKNMALKIELNQVADEKNKIETIRDVTTMKKDIEFIKDLLEKIEKKMP